MSLRQWRLYELANCGVMVSGGKATKHALLIESWIAAPVPDKPQ